MGLVGGFGAGRAAFGDALARGTVRPKRVMVDGTEVSALTADLAALTRFFSQRQLRRIERFSQLALLGCCLALEDAGEPWPSRKRMGLIVATGWGPTPDRFDFDDCEDDSEPPLFSPLKFANSVQNAPAAHISILLKMDGPTLTVNDHLLSFSTAMLTAKQWLEEARVDAVLVGGVDEACLSHGLWRQRAADAGDSRFSEDARICGEGSAFFLLVNDTGASPYGRLTAVEMGRGPIGRSAVSRDAVVILEGDAPPDLMEQTIAGAPIVRYRHLYGQFPVGSAFAMAAAALAIQAGAFHDPGDETPIPLNGRDIACLTLGVADTWAGMTLAPNRSDRSVRPPSTS